MAEPANGSGKRVASPPNPPPKGRNVDPENEKSSRPSPRGSNLASADPYIPGNVIGVGGSLGLTLISANSAEFMNDTLYDRLVTSPVARCKSPVDVIPGTSET